MATAYLIRVKGLVQGVGFRPNVHRLATDVGLAGTVLNDGAGVQIRVEGEAQKLDIFVKRLKTEVPRLAYLESVTVTEVKPAGLTDFRIIESEATAVITGVTPDAAICDACLKELLDASDRRYRYPFINCTHCGPRFTITAHLPYDRPQTSMAKFTQCEACLTEYTDPVNRRFHAQPNACPVCGPQVRLTNAKGEDLTEGDVFEAAIRVLREGRILAVKGLGGFHLVCDAQNAKAVALLRHRKAREAKPFAVMVANAKSAARFAQITPETVKALTSVEAPIVLAPKNAQTDRLLEGVAPDLTAVGLMLPYTPLHWLLFFEAAGRPAGGIAAMREELDFALVMTSANPSGEPLVIDNDEAYARLSTIADAFLIHNRDILLRCDDSVVVTDDTTHLIRRARGYTPRAIYLEREAPSVLATGAFYKSTACLTKENRAYLTAHVGELDRASNCRALKDGITHLAEVLEIAPVHVACDLHPDFYSSRLAEDFATRFDCELTPVQHHHAHICAVMAEHRIARPVLGLAIDGTGLGTDGTIWGGELLRVAPEGFERLAHLAPLSMPGGEICAREGFRMAMAVSRALGREYCPTHPKALAVQKLLEIPSRQPVTTSLGRYFDAAAAMAGLCLVSRYEGEAPMVFEGTARHGVGVNLTDCVSGTDGTLDIRELVWRMAAYDGDYASASRDFHTTLAHALATWIATFAEKTGITEVVVSGGCAMNRLLMIQLKALLVARHLTLFEAREAPPNDGSISLGQAWSVMMRL